MAMFGKPLGNQCHCELFGSFLDEFIVTHGQWNKSLDVPDHRHAARTSHKGAIPAEIGTVGHVHI
jgi:hypothetical protein